MSHRSGKYGSPIVVYPQDSYRSSSSVSSRDSRSSSYYSTSSAGSSTYSTSSYTSSSSSGRSSSRIDDIHRDPNATTNQVAVKHGHRPSVVVINQSSRRQQSPSEPRPSYGHSSYKRRDATIY